MKELQVPFDSAWILKNRRKIKKALLADGTPRMEKRLQFWVQPVPSEHRPWKW